MDGVATSTILGLGGLAVGVVFGAIVQRTNFCTLGAISDLILMEDGRRMRAWALATAVALFGTQAMHLAGLIDIDSSFYLSSNLGWAGAILGGLMFGFGMTKTGGCAGRTLVRLGAGNLKSLVVLLIMGMFAYMTLRGIIAPLRAAMEGALNADLKSVGLKTQGIGEFFSRFTGLSPVSGRVAATVLVGGGLLYYCFKDREFRKSGRNVLAGIGIGLTILAGWVVTGILAKDEFSPTPLMSLSFASPTAEFLQYLMVFTGTTINFGAALVAGVLLGSFLMAKATGRFRLESFADQDDLLRHLGGAALMGVGAILSLGCTIGQGMTGTAALALGGLVAWASIIAGTYYGVKYLEEGSYTGALKACFGATG